MRRAFTPLNRCYCVAVAGGWRREGGQQITAVRILQDGSSLTAKEGCSKENTIHMQKNIWSQWKSKDEPCVPHKNTWTPADIMSATHLVQVSEKSLLPRRHKPCSRASHSQLVLITHTLFCAIPYQIFVITGCMEMSNWPFGSVTLHISPVACGTTSVAPYSSAECRTKCHEIKLARILDTEIIS
jgi:hypothetical protein